MLSEILALPVKRYEKDDGSEGWSYILSFYSKDRWTQFQKMCVKALDTYLADTKKTEEMADIPF